ncbi:hypothetical protein [Streptomyces sp. NPDC094149]|uniref:hypothetical protein n=1 Tax=Streptomyces sp. NPDC094149 TaxID=3155079 RepID=UPI0033225FE1
MSEQAVMLHGPAAGKAFDVELNAIGHPPHFLMVIACPAGVPGSSVEHPQPYRLLLWRATNAAAKDDDGRWQYV